MTDEKAGRDAQAVGHILLYGTLRAGQPAHRTLGLERALTLIGPRRINGVLYDLGAYPGLVLGGGGPATAELYRLDRLAVLSRLDAFEGYDPRQPARSLFVRTKVDVEPGSDGCSRCDAWLYVYNGPLAGTRKVIGGSWPEYIAARRAAPSFQRRG